MSTIDNVLASQTCVGCGGCGTATAGRIPITLNAFGYYEADLSDASERDKALAAAVCPFADESAREDVIAATVLPNGLPYLDGVGFYKSVYAGRVSDDEAIPRSSSGGLTNWLVLELLRRGRVDGVIHVGSGEEELFGYTVSRTPDEVLAARKSKYHPATFDRVLNEVRGDGRTYAFVGVPCAVRSARLVAAQDERIAVQIKYYVGIVCGHMKSSAYARSFAWQLGVEPSELAEVDFRIKDPERTSREYKFGARRSGSGTWVEAPTLSLVGGSWGHALFQLNACNFCDDIFAETADVVFGDAWLAKYEIDWRGTNIAITRHDELDSLLRDGAERGEIVLNEEGPETAVRTQAGNFRHRRQDLAVRLADDRQEGRWSPRKRVAPSYDGVSPERVKLVRQRRELAARSHNLFEEALQQGDLSVFLGQIRPLIDAYQKVTTMTFRTRVWNKAKRELWKIVSRLPRSRGRVRNG